MLKWNRRVYFHNYRGTIWSVISFSLRFLPVRPLTFVLLFLLLIKMPCKQISSSLKKRGKRRWTAAAGFHHVYVHLLSQGSRQVEALFPVWTWGRVLTTEWTVISVSEESESWQHEFKFRQAVLAQSSDLSTKLVCVDVWATSSMSFFLSSFQILYLSFMGTVNASVSVNGTRTIWRLVFFFP